MQPNLASADTITATAGTNDTFKCYIIRSSWYTTGVSGVETINLNANCNYNDWSK